jgi:hypothetical protein
MEKNSINAEKFRIALFRSLAVLPSKNMQKNSTTSEKSSKCRKIQKKMPKNSINAQKFQIFKKIRNR